MAVYKMRTMDEIFAALKKVARRLTDECTLTLSPNEFIQAFVLPEHVEPLKQVQGIVGTVGDTSSLTKLATSEGTLVYTYITFGFSEPPIILPKYIRDGMTSAAPDSIVEKVTAFVDERFRLGRIFGDAVDALHYLNEHSGNAAAMSVFFPALPTLLSLSDPNPDSANAKRAKRLAESKSFGSLATLPREVKLRMLEVSSLVMTASMLEESSGKNGVKTGETTLSVSHPVDDLPDFVWATQGQFNAASFI
jgi:hypothetical protein